MIKIVLVHHTIHANMTEHTPGIHSLSNMTVFVNNFIPANLRGPFDEFQSNMKIVSAYCVKSKNVVLAPELINPYIPY